MKNKGFTLIELLGVIIILALLMLLVFPSIINSVKNTSDEIDDLTLELIYNASDLYIGNHIDNFPKVNGNKFIIDLSDLISEDLLPSSITTSSGEKIENNKCVQVTYNNVYKYELKDSGTCEGIKIICKTVTTPTIGNTPAGNYEPGDEYTCNVDGTNSYNFVVVNSTETTVSLVTTEPIGEIEYITKEKFLELGGELEDCGYDSSGCVTRNFGPVTALTLTNNWVNVESISLPSISDVIPPGCDLPPESTNCSAYWALNLDSVWLEDMYTEIYSTAINQPELEKRMITLNDKYVGEKYNFSPKITISKYSIKR